MQPEDQIYSRGDRSPAFILVMSLITCGIYLFFWYYQVYAELQDVHGVSPTGNGYFVDLLLVIITCGLWGVYVDYAISEKLNIIQERHGMAPNDTTTAAILLDLAAFFVGLTNLVTSMIQQDQLNKIRIAMAGTNTSSTGESSPAHQNSAPQGTTSAPDFPRPQTDYGPAGKSGSSGPDNNPYN
ncbi:MAG: DUF4234 domain-containing protein [Leptospiraceae bacterium]|nr:DUF4234 domain-containing protein [Leptospiraceae bacterium]